MVDLFGGMIEKYDEATLHPRTPINNTHTTNNNDGHHWENDGGLTDGK